MCVPEKKYKYGRDSHGSNVKDTIRLKITCTCDHDFLGTLEVSIVGYLEIMKDLMGSYRHTFQLITVPNGGDRRPVGEDGDFGEDKNRTVCEYSDDDRE